MTKTKHTLASLCDSIWNKKWKLSKNAKSQASILRCLKATFGDDTLISRIDTAKIEKATERWQEEGSSTKTCNRRLSSLSAILRWAHNRRIIDRMPHIERFKEGPGRLRVISPEEEERLIAWFHQKGEEAHAELVALLVDTGARSGEIFALPWENVKENLILLEETKNGHPRQVPLTRRASKILSCRPRSAEGPFTMIAKSSWSASWNRAKASLGIEDPHFVPHALRHTFASRLLERNVDVFTLSRLLGHSSIKTTADVYGHLSMDTAVSAIAVLE